MSVPELAERFWAKVDKDGPISEYAPELGPCWLWTAAQDGRGYGAFCNGQRTAAGNPKVVKAYRWAWEDANGSVPAGLQLDHLCRVKLCIRPLHLEPVTSAENLRRAPFSGADFQKAKTHCPDGHSYAEHGFVDAHVNGRRCRLCWRRTCREAQTRYRERQRARLQQEARSA